jgi:hypothetical protein
MDYYEDGVMFRSDKEDSEWREYALRIPIVGGHFWDAGHGLSPKPERQVHPTMALTFKVRGLEHVYVHDGYTLKVRRAAMWPWADIHPAITAIVKDHNKNAAWPVYDEPELITSDCVTTL